MKKLLRQHEFVLLLLLVIPSLLIGWLNPAFFSPANLFDLLKGSVVLGILALGVLLVIVSGNIDISFPAIAAFSMYVACLIARAAPWADSIAVIFLLAVGIGALLGMINAVLIHHFKLPALIVTLGTAGLIRGCLLAFVGTRILTNLPPSMIAFARADVLHRELPSGETYGLAASFFLLVAVATGAWLLLNRTLPGRGIYALGGAPEAARRVGFNLRRIQYLIYALVGGLAGVAGIIHASNLRNANPFDLAGIELTVIAAVVLGGADINGGKGTVTGTLLGVFILVTLNKSLLLVGLPTEWHRVAIGLVIIASTAATALRNRNADTIAV